MKSICTLAGAPLIGYIGISDMSVERYYEEALSCSLITRTSFELFTGDRLAGDLLA